MKCLVVYYSRDGHTRKVAESLAEKLGADVEPITEQAERGGIIGFIKAGAESMRGTIPKINAVKSNVADYDLVAVGTPVWAGTVASPVRSFLKEHGAGVREAAFFCTMGGEDTGRAFDEMRELIGKAAKAEAGFRARTVDDGSYLKALEDYAEKLA